MIYGVKDEHVVKPSIICQLSHHISVLIEDLLKNWTSSERLGRRMAPFSIVFDIQL